MTRLEGKVAIITGAANGIGLEAAKVFSREGATVVIADFNEAAGKEAEESTPGVTFIQVDVSNRESVDRLVEHCGRAAWQNRYSD